MSIGTAGKALFICIFLPLLFSCGEMGMLFPSNGSYQIKAAVNGNSLEKCSLIRAEDQIQPYFADSVADDPDLTGLLVYLHNSQGHLAGEKIQYAIRSFYDDDDSPDSYTEENESPEDAENEGLSDSEQQEPAAQAASQSSAVNQSTSEKSRFIKVKSFDGDLPYFPLPKNLEIGSYNLIFEALGGKNTLSRTEMEIFYLGDTEFYLKDIAMYLPGVSSSRLIPPGATVMLEAGLDYDSRLDPYVIWYSGKKIISEGRIKEDAGNILWEMPDQAGFYSLRLEVLPFQLKRGFSGFSREITLTVSPKAVNNGYFFPHSPESAVWIPLTQMTVYPKNTETALTSFAPDVSASDIPASPGLLHLYQFGGSMHDSASSLQTESITPVFNRPPKWVTVGPSFGLFTGPDDSYTLPPFSFFRKNQEKGGGIFLFHIKPVKGVIFNAFFPSKVSPSEGVTMELTGTEDSVLLHVGVTGENNVELSLDSTSSSRQSYIPVAVEFFFHPHRLEVKLILGEPPFSQSVTGSVKIGKAATGEGNIRLGGGPAYPEMKKSSNIPMPENTGEILEKTEETASARLSDEARSESADETEKEPLPSGTVWNEFAVLYSQIPLLPEEDSMIATEAKKGEANKARIFPSEDLNENL